MTIGKLSDTKCRKTAYNPDGTGNKLTDGGGLYLHIKPTGKYWRLNYRFLGKQKTLALGVYPRVTLADARDRREEAKKMIDAGKDPSTEKKIAKIELQTSYDNSFESVAREWHKQNAHTWKPKHADNVLKRLERNVFKYIGSRPIKEVTPPELLNAVQSLEKEGKRDLAHRMLQHCSKIYGYAISAGLAKENIADKLKGALQPVKSKGLAYLQENELPEFLYELEQYDTKYNGNILTKLAFKLMILTFVRSGEIRGAKWDEIDWDKKLWKIPEERMKMKGIPHVVPLAKQSIDILKELQNITGHNAANYIFPSQQNPRKTMSENTFLRAIDVMGYKGRTVGHGFRSTASTILNEAQFRPDIIERQLAHAERDGVRKAYNHAEYLSERAEMMQWYADHIDKLRKKRK